MSHNLKVNDKIKLGYGHIWTVKAVSERYVICTKPYRKIKNVWYTILDFERQIRGTHNYVFSPYDMSIQEDIDQCLKDLISGEIEISHRRNVPLEEIEVIKKDEIIRNFK